MNPKDGGDMFIRSRNISHQAEQIIVLFIVTGMSLLTFIAAETCVCLLLPNKFRFCCYLGFYAVPLPRNGLFRHHSVRLS
jgi:hypothetical protein